MKLISACSRVALALATACPCAFAQYQFDNDFVANAFPKPVSERIFQIPIDPNELLVVCPAGTGPAVESMRRLLRERTGKDIPFLSATDVSEPALKQHHLIVIGNISDNWVALALYKRRYAFADAYFPGSGGVAIHPAKSIWNSARNALVIGVSRDEDALAGFQKFAGLLGQGSGFIPPIRYLRTSLVFPAPRDSVTAVFADSLKSPHVNEPPYGEIANWGVSYHLTGDKRWAQDFLEGFRACYDRARATGQWVPEMWTNVYFNLWKMVYAWQLIDDDPVFSPADRKLVNEVIWGYARFSNWLPNLNPNLAPPDEPRQNHTTFLALSLFYSYRYLTEEYGITGLDQMLEKCTRAFEHGEAVSYRPNDDGGSYLLLAPLHLLTYEMARGEDEFLANGKLKELVDVVFSTTDNRNDRVTFGDESGYRHRSRMSPRGSEISFFGLAAWYYKDPRYRWLYNWSSHTTDTGDPGELRFSFEELYTGSYALPMPEKPSTEYFGVHPVLLDQAALAWAARRADQPDYLPLEGERYIDKLVFRPDLNPMSEYLLMDGTSTFSHGHDDGNTVTRLTWKDRLWLSEGDYIKRSARYHIGVVVTRNGVQRRPPPLTSLDFAADTGDAGFSRTTARDFNDCDWERNVVWKKGKYFLFLDQLRAREEGNYRLESRWRAVGDATLQGNEFSAKQGGESLFIVSADQAPRKITHEAQPVSPARNVTTREPSNVPPGGGEVAICYARRQAQMARNDRYMFANLVYVDQSAPHPGRKLYQSAQGQYVISGGGESEIAGLDPSALARFGVTTDSGLYLLDDSTLDLLNATQVRFGEAAIEAPRGLNISLDYRKGTGSIIVPEGPPVQIELRNVTLSEGGRQAARLSPGRYAFHYTAAPSRLAEFIAQARREALVVNPLPSETLSNDFGLTASRDQAGPARITAFAPDGTQLIYGDANGNIYRSSQDRSEAVVAVPSHHPIAVLYAADINGDGSNEILAADNTHGLYCYSANGKPLWNYNLGGYRGESTAATHITLADIDGSGKPSILVATKGWMLQVFHADGTLRWATFTKYHEETMVKALRNKDGSSYIVVGTNYVSPINVLSPQDGKLLWYAWEEVGSEFLVTTPYYGFDLTDMTFLAVDASDKDAIVFGNRSNSVFAVAAENGALKWEANVGDEVTAIRKITDFATGEERLVVATAGGDVFVYSPAGQRLRGMSAGRAITALEVIPYRDQRRNDLVLATEDGSIVICDDAALRVRASVKLGNAPILGVILGGRSGREQTIRGVMADGTYTLRYQPFFLWNSRDY